MCEFQIFLYMLISAHKNHKKIIWNDFWWLFPIPDLSNLTSLFCMSCSAWSSSLLPYPQQKPFFMYLKSLLSNYLPLLRDRKMTKINWPSKMWTPPISGQGFLHQWCPLINGSTVIHKIAIIKYASNTMIAEKSFELP